MSWDWKTLFAALSVILGGWALYENIRRRKAEERLRRGEKTPVLGAKFGRGSFRGDEHFENHFDLENQSARPLFVRKARLRLRWRGPSVPNRPTHLPCGPIGWNWTQEFKVGEVRPLSVVCNPAAPWEDLDTEVSRFAVLEIDTNLGPWEQVVDDEVRGWQARLIEWRKAKGMNP